MNIQNKPFDGAHDRPLDEARGKQKITPNLWFDNQAKEAAEFYTSIFSNAKIKNTTTLHNTPSGSVDIVTIEILDFKLSC